MAEPPAFELPPLRVEDALQVGEVLVGDARGGDTGHRRLEHAADVEQLVLQIVTIREDRRQRRDQAVDVQLARERALPVPRLEQADRFERAERVADRPRLTPNRAAEQRARRAAAGPAGTCRRE